MDKQLMTGSDQRNQEKPSKCSAQIVDNKLLLQINDLITYKGQIDGSPYYDISQLKSIFEKGDIQILVKTTSKMVIKLAILKIQLQSDQSRKLDDLKKKIQQLEDKLKNNASQWIEQDLNSTAGFQMNCIYKIDTTGGWSLSSVAVSTGSIYFMYAGSSYTTSSSNRRANSTGWAVTRMWKHRI